jgi:hypothetical protein
MDRLTPPAFFDEGYDGSWLEALRFVHFPVSDYAVEPVEDLGRRLANRDGSLAPFVSFHATGDTDEQQ